MSAAYISMLYIALLFISALLCVVSFSWYVFCLLVALVKSSLLVKRLARKTPLRKPDRRQGSSP